MTLKTLSKSHRKTTQLLKLVKQGKLCIQIQLGRKIVPLWYSTNIKERDICSFSQILIDNIYEQQNQIQAVFGIQ